MDSQTPAFCRPTSGTPGLSKKLHYIIIASVIPTLAFDIPVAVIQRNPGAILGVILVGISGILSIYRSGLLSLKKPNGQSYEYQTLLPEQETLMRGIEGVRSRVGNVGKTEKTFFALVDFLMGATLLVAIVLLYMTHGYYSRWYYEDPAMIVVKTWGSWPLCLVCLIHAYLFFHTVIHAIMSPCNKSIPLCSRCQGPLCGENSPPPSEPADSARPSMESVAPEMVSMV